MKKILVAIDMTAGSRNALGRALRLAQAAGASVRVLHVVPSSAFAMETPEARRLVQEAVREVVEGLPEPRPEVSIGISCLTRAEAILHGARRFGADLIVLGAHGEPRFRDAIFGTTATHVVRHADCPVLVAQNDPVLPYRTVMLAVGDAEEAIALRAVTEGVAPRATLTGVNAFHASFRDLLAGQAALDRDASAHEAQLGIALPGVTPVAAPGDPMTVLMDEARELAPDLVAMGTSQRAYLNSYAVDAMFWCERDLLIVPSPDRPVAATPASGGAVLA